MMPRSKSTDYLLASYSVVRAQMVDTKLHQARLLVLLTNNSSWLRIVPMYLRAISFSCQCRSQVVAFWSRLSTNERPQPMLG